MITEEEEPVPEITGKSATPKSNMKCIEMNDLIHTDFWGDAAVEL